MTRGQLKHGQRLISELDKLQHNMDLLEAMMGTGGILLLKDQNGHAVTTAFLEEEDRIAVISTMAEAVRRALSQRLTEFVAL